MNIVDKILLESKQVGILYHYTSLSNLISIINDNCLKSSHSETFMPNSISFTRNKNYTDFNSKFTGISNNLCRLVIDGNKLSNNYKIIPKNVYSTKIGQEWLKGQLNKNNLNEIFISLHNVFF